MVSLPPAGRAGSLPPSARRSAEHGRALKAADRFGLRLAKKLVQRPLMSVWEGARADGSRVTLTVVDACATEDERARILEAASALRGIESPRVQHVTEVDAGVHAFLSDQLASGTAADVLVLRWHMPERLQFVARVCEGLEAVHRGGVVHGSLCLENVSLDENFAPLLAEVGMVSLAESLEGDREGFFGYGAYASPEAQLGGTLDARSDVFSIGRLLAFVVLEKEPDEGAAEALAQQNAALGALYRKCTAAAPGERHKSVADVTADLARIRKDLGPLVAIDAVSAGGPPEPAAAAPQKAPPAIAAVGTSFGDDMKHARPALGLVSLGFALAALVFSYFVAISDAQALGLGLVVVAGAAGATMAIPVSSGRWRAIVALSTAAVLVLLRPVHFVGAAGARRRVHGADVVSGQAVKRLLRDGDRHFGGAKLAGADLAHVDLAWAELDSADLTGADLSRANLTSASLRRTNLARARLQGADLTGCDLGAAYGLDSAECDTTTLMPEGWRCLNRAIVRARR